MAADVTADAPVINDVIDVLDDALGFWIAALVTDPEIMREGDVVALAEAAEPLRTHSGTDDAVLKGDIPGLAQPDAIPTTPLDRDVIEDDRVALREPDSVLLFLAGR